MFNVVSQVLEESPATGSRRLVLIVLAEAAHADGTGAWRSIKTIAERARCSRRTAQYALRELERAGEIVATGRHASGTTIYCVTPGGADVARGASRNTSGAQSASRGALQVAPEPSKEPSKEPTAPPKASPSEDVKFAAWLDHHEQVTDRRQPRRGTAARGAVATSYRARRDEGYSAEDLKLATAGAYGDRFRRENGHYGPESVLRQTKVHDLIEKGRCAGAGSERRSAYDDLSVEA